MASQNTEGAATKTDAPMKVERDRSPAKPDKEGSGEQNGSRSRDTRPHRDSRDGRDGRDGRERRPREVRPPPGRPSGGDRKQRPERRLYVSNIPFEFQWQELKDLFRKEVGDVSFVEVFYDEKGSSRGCGIIEFESQDLVSKALEKMHRFELKGRNIVVKEDFGVERDRCGRIVRDGGRHELGGPPGRPDRGMDAPRRGGFGGPGGAGSHMGRGTPGGHGGGGGGGYRDRDDRGRMGPPAPPEAKYTNTYGLNVSFLESLGIDGPLVNRVFVANLDYSVDEKKLKEVFALAGKVVSVEINKDHEGNSKGHGVVQFEHPVEAVQAISMLNNQTYLDRRISVRMDRVAERRDRDPKMSLPAGLKSIGQGLGSNGTALSDVASKLQENSVAPAPSVPSVPLGGAAAAGASGGGGGGGGAGALGLMGAAPSLGGGLPELGGLSALGQLQAAQLGQLGTAGYGAALAGIQGVAGLRGTDGLAGRAALDPTLAGRTGLEAAGRAPLLDSGLGGGRAALLEPGLADRGGLDQGFGSRGGLDQGFGSRGGLDQGYSSRSGLDQGLGSRGGLDQGLGSRGGLDQGFGSRSSLDQGLGSRGTGDQGFGGRGGLDSGLGGRGGSMDHGLGSRGSMDHGMGGRGLMDQGLGSRGSLDGGRSGRGSYSSGYGSSMSSSGDGGYSSSSRSFSDSIIVSNLDPSYTWQALRDKFRDLGEVRYADMKGKGVGVVRFSSPHDAQRAISMMDGARCDGRVLDVRSY